MPEFNILYQGYNNKIIGVGSGVGSGHMITVGDGFVEGKGILENYEGHDMFIVSGSGSGSSGSGGGEEPEMDSAEEDRTPPTIRSVSGTTQGRKFTIQWVTDEPATTWLDFSEYGAYGDDVLTTTHAISLNGQRGQTYTFTLVSSDATGNTAASSPYSISL